MPRHSSARAFGARGSSLSLSLHKRPLAAREIRPPPRKSYIKRARPGSAGDKVTLRARAGRRPPASRRGARVKARRFTAGHNVEAGGGGRGANKSVRAGRGLPKSPPRGPARPRKFARCPPLIEETADYSIRTRVSRPGLSALPCPCPEALRARVRGRECLPAWPLPSPRLPLPPPPPRLFTEELLPAVPRLALVLCPPDWRSSVEGGGGVAALPPRADCALARSPGRWWGVAAARGVVARQPPIQRACQKLPAGPKSPPR
ncbi:uncharacterized protein LOC126234872 [Schistocerca nitens]|uniref:uncharacterized protein LOC126234872 n=1 Tax=Schistocerca nitens TaxID=7011 RepID=UPI002117E7C8|nr:uncharacterized protein LOC126234872 [Schistocerca nitens]